MGSKMGNRKPRADKGAEGAIKGQKSKAVRVVACAAAITSCGHSATMSAISSSHTRSAIAKQEE